MFFCSIITISLLCALVAFFEEKLSNFKWWIWGLLCFLLIIVATFRPLGMDNDSIAYEIYYYNFDTPRSVLTVEYSFRVISEFIYNYFHNYRYLFLLYALLGTTIKFYSIKKLSPLPFLSVCIYIFTYYVVHEFTQIRAGVASAFLLLSLIPLSKGNKSLTLVFILFASLFHYSSLLMSILLCFDNKTMSKKNKYYWCLLLPLGYLLHYIGIGFSFIYIPYISDKVDAYQALKEQGLLDVVNVYNLVYLAKIFIFFYIMYFYDIISQRCSCLPILLKLEAFSLFAFSAFSSLPVLSFRINGLFGIVEIILYPLIYYTIHPWYYSKLIVFGIGAILFAIFVFYNGLLQIQ